MPTPVELDGKVAPSSAPLPKDKCLLTVITGAQRGLVIAVDDGAELLIGRGDYADVRAVDPGVSWIHARVRRRGSEVRIEDMNSTNGTYIGSMRIGGVVALPDGAHIGLGHGTVLRFTRCDALELEAALKQYDSTIRDALTTIHNRGHFDERLESEFSFAVRHEVPLSVLMFDIDHFKSVNDRFGHAVGDAALRVVAASVRRMLRPEDVFARYGGEEFAILARDVSLANATILGRRIREHVQALALPCGDEVVHLTVSVGVVAQAPGQGYASARALMESVDHAMYAAKANGRNCVVSIPEPAL